MGELLPFELDLSNTGRPLSGDPLLRARLAAGSLEEVGVDAEGAMEVKCRGEMRSTDCGRAGDGAVAMAADMVGGVYRPAVLGIMMSGGGTSRVGW